MNRVGLLFIAHDQIAGSLVRTVESTMGSFPLPYTCLAVEPADDTNDLIERGQRAAKDLLDDVDELLVLTDIYGATPSNVAHQLADVTAIVHGLNLPLLMRLANYAGLPAQELAVRAIEGGQRGLFVGESPA